MNRFINPPAPADTYPDVYIGLGSNLASPVDQVRQAFERLSMLPGSSLVATSSLYKSAPIGVPGQSDYINAVALIRTRLSAEDLLRALQAIEFAQGRLRTNEKWGPRPLDLDILLFGDQLIQTEMLTIPHSELANRNFVLLPLLEIKPELALPDGRSLKSLLEKCPHNPILKL